jgi:hypothetical protein
MKLVSIVSLVTVLALFTGSGCAVQKGMHDSSGIIDTIRIPGTGAELALEFQFNKGEAHNHPTFAIWVEDMNENYIQTLFVTRSIGTGIFGHGSVGKEQWDVKPGPQRRPATVPYWLHKRSDFFKVPLLPDSEHPVTDGYTGATPVGDFVITSGLNKSLPQKFRLMLEINQPWDWNEYWTNSLYDDPDYRTSCQPSLVYAVTVDLNDPAAILYMNPIGHGHYAGKDGKLYTDLSTMTTALDIVEKAVVTLIK